MANVEAVASPQGTKRTRDDVEAEDATQNTNAANQDDDGKHATNSHHDRGLSEQLPQCTMLSMLLVPGPVSESEGLGLSLARPIRREALCIATAPQRAPLEIES